jgi:iron complex outermembrane receptor protein
VKNRRFALVLGAAAIAIPATRAVAQDAAAPQPIPAAGQDLSQLSIEELAQLPVRSASKRQEPLSAAPTSLFVITNDDLLNSAATTLPEALRLAPNLNVQQVNAHEYAISARGFNSLETANKLLVLIDGRSVYSTLHSGVFWDLRMPMLEDLAQIEVISGPGGTLYGPNAVNGVISIVSRDASETIGGLVRGTLGAREQSAAARYGFTLGGAGALRLYANWFNFDDHDRGPLGPVLNDDFEGWRAGFRSDFASERSHFTLQGDIFGIDVDTLPGDGGHGRNLTARWTRELSDGASFQVQAYYDYARTTSLLTRDSLETFDVEAQGNVALGSHDLVLGGGLRTTRDQFINNLNGFQLNPQQRRLWIYNAFIQDRFALSDRLSLVLGVKVEETSFTGLQFLPNARLAWRPDERTLIWGAVSRAVRTPSRIDRQLEFLPLLAGGSFESEKLIAFEAGYRGQPSQRSTLSVSMFYNRYDDIRTTEFQPGNVLPIQLVNGLEGHSYGFEAWSTSQLAPWLRVNLGVSGIWKDFHLKAGHVDLAQRDSLGHDPDIQLFVRAEVHPAERLRMTFGLRRIGALNDGAAEPAIGGYLEADANLSYRLSELIELYVAGNNLLHATHLESNDTQRVQLAHRSLFAGARLRF